MSVEIDGVNNIIKADTISEVTSANGVTIDGLTIKDGAITATTGTIVFNEASADVDFRVESNGVDKMLFVNGGTNTVSIGGEATPLGRLHVITADSGSSAHANADEFVIEGSAYSGMTIASGTTSHGTIAFADSGDELAGRIIYNHSTNAMSFGTSGVGTQWSINSDGNLLPGNSTGQGIHLGVTSAGAANLLDDYEEGTWTMGITDGSNTMTLAGSGYNTGKYFKIGNKVYVQGFLDVQAVGSCSGNLKLTGLPFTCANVPNANGAVLFGYGGGLSITAGTNLAGYVASNNTSIELRTWDATTGTTALQASELSTGEFIFSATYYVS